MAGKAGGAYSALPDRLAIYVSTFHNTVERRHDYSHCHLRLLLHLVVAEKADKARQLCSREWPPQFVFQINSGVCWDFMVHICWRGLGARNRHEWFTSVE